MFSIIILSLIVIVAVVMVLGALFSPEGGPRLAAAAAGIMAVIFVIAWLAFSFTTVGAKQIGVVTAFGKTTGSLEAGPHLTKPWESVTELDGAVITQKFTMPQDRDSSDSNRHCFPVQIGDLSQACVAGVWRYEHEVDKADDLYVEYRNIEKNSDEIEDLNEAIQDALVRTQSTAVIGEVMRDFNPLIAATDQAGEKQVSAKSAPSLQALTDEINEAIDDRLPGINTEVSKATGATLGFTVTRLDFSAETNANIKRLQEQGARTREAQELKATNELIAEANQKLADSVSNAPNVVVSRCYDLVQKALEAEYALPGNFQCWPGGSGGVLVDGRTAEE